MRGSRGLRHRLFLKLKNSQHPPLVLLRRVRHTSVLHEAAGH